MPWWCAGVYLPRKAFPVHERHADDAAEDVEAVEAGHRVEDEPKSETCGLNPSCSRCRYS